ncbi:anthranilate synthase component I family protein [Staphylococcus epidermidis]|uniref:anthranilate synthase component I family protein n=1 Tax=Bacillati TaxID=1783272 RepID=UPI00195A056E|nr:anthranilate synthase component I family protein [Staphylococcus epidermidis]MBM6078043.1 anthranilate synthase component I family protein [Staphylococcus epidermidis]MBM6082616.1 anthranilate synthase component I family protein [Staphylococcus epidermidis]MEB6727284.1 anthranilate synthase component I family protein [Staphylococcus epidermidis]QRT38554.1 anthranilate synthase component I family protein [Staphylococcus epidermidis]
MCEQDFNNILSLEKDISNVSTSIKKKLEILRDYPKSSLFETRKGFQNVDGKSSNLMIGLLLEIKFINNNWEFFSEKIFQNCLEKCKKIMNSKDIEIKDKFRKILKLLQLPEDYPIVFVLGYSATRFFENISNFFINKEEPEIIIRVYHTIIQYDYSIENRVKIKYLNIDEFKHIVKSVTAKLKSKYELDLENHWEKGSIENITEKNVFLNSVKRAKDYIKSGDIYQVQLSRLAKSNSQITPLKLFENLTKINPSPYMYYIDLGENKVISSSPELMIRVKNNNAQVRPIAGTKLKNKDNNNLAGIAKEQAEHLMLVDLSRNDLARCSKKNSLRVPSFMKEEDYGSLIHLVSTIETTVDENYDIFDILSHNYPAGTMTGAPKIRAIEIINDLEKNNPRGLFSGCAGYLSKDNIGTFALTIRTVFGKQGNYSLRAAAGIVSDSNPHSEWEEAGNKIQSFSKALGGVF